jgi:hypothetical protein
MVLSKVMEAMEMSVLIAATRIVMIVEKEPFRQELVVAVDLEVALVVEFSFRVSEL